jgi:hypothetical protein
MTYTDYSKLHFYRLRITPPFQSCGGNVVESRGLQCVSQYFVDLHIRSHLFKVFQFHHSTEGPLFIPEWVIFIIVWKLQRPLLRLFEILNRKAVLTSKLAFHRAPSQGPSVCQVPSSRINTLHIHPIPLKNLWPPPIFQQLDFRRLEPDLVLYLSFKHPPHTNRPICSSSLGKTFLRILFSLLTLRSLGKNGLTLSSDHPHLQLMTIRSALSWLNHQL